MTIARETATLAVAVLPPFTALIWGAVWLIGALT